MFHPIDMTTWERAELLVGLAHKDFRDSLIAANALRGMVHFACLAVDAYNDKFLQVNGNDMDCDEVADFIA